MTSSLQFSAHLSRSAFVPRERVALTLSVQNTGPNVELLPNPSAGGGSSLRLFLTPSKGPQRAFSPGDIPPPHGTQEDIIRLRVLPGASTPIELDVAEAFDPLPPGDYQLTVDYEWAAGQTWSSPALSFTIAPPAATWAGVTPSETARVGHVAIDWVTPDGATSRVLRFDDDRYARVVRGAIETLTVPLGAELAVSTAPAGLPQMDRWVAYRTGHSLAVAFPTLEDGLAVAARTTALPPSMSGARLAAPLLAENAPDEPRPRATACLWQPEPGGGASLVLADISADGDISYSAPVVFAEEVLAIWPTTPSPWGRIVVVATRVPQGIHLAGVAAAWGAEPGPPSDIFTIPADELLGGDVRCDLQGKVWIGLVVRRASAWVRASFAVPVQDPANDVRTEVLGPGPGRTFVRAQLDAHGGVHTLFREGGALFYVPAGASGPLWSSPRIGAKGSREALILRPGRPAFLVYHDADTGVTKERLG